MTEIKNSGKISRRDLIVLTGASVVATSLASQFLKPQSAIAETNSKDAATKVTPDQAIKKLMDGNQRYIQQKRIFPDQNKARISALAQSQHPFAVVIGCSDSRVPPELLFDQGLGDIFDIRLAGNIIDDAVLGSAEYAVAELGVPLILVLGHERCGAVKATLDGKPVPGKIGTLVAAIKPALDKIQNQSGDKLDNLVRTNVKMSVDNLKVISPILAEALKAGKLKVIGGRYDLD
ncbi:MAG TPA: carbonic anhydrase, partial [Kamptonema sp.]|nr:carbonic anhydrase [Kamptonema sp.]